MKSVRRWNDQKRIWIVNGEKAAVQFKGSHKTDEYDVLCAVANAYIKTLELDEPFVSRIVKYASERGVHPRTAYRCWNKNQSVIKAALRAPDRAAALEEILEVKSDPLGRSLDDRLSVEFQEVYEKPKAAIDPWKKLDSILNQRLSLKK